MRDVDEVAREDLPRIEGHEVRKADRYRVVAEQDRAEADPATLAVHLLELLYSQSSPIEM